MRSRSASSHMLITSFRAPFFLAVAANVSFSSPQSKPSLPHSKTHTHINEQLYILTQNVKNAIAFNTDSNVFSLLQHWNPTLGIGNSWNQEFQERLLLTYKPEEATPLPEDQKPAEEEQTPPPIPQEEVAPPPPNIDTTRDLSGLDVVHPDASAIEDSNALALAIVHHVPLQVIVLEPCKQMLSILPDGNSLWLPLPATIHQLKGNWLVGWTLSPLIVYMMKQHTDKLR